LLEEEKQEMEEATIRMIKRKRHTTTKYENAVASLYLEVVKGPDYSEMLFTMEDRETWWFGGDYNEVKDKEKIK
jgi:hypothetical protein